MKIFTVFVENLMLPCFIGVTPPEQGVQQRVRFSVQIILAGNDAPKNLKQSVPYEEVIAYIEKLSHTHIDLVETFAETISNYCMQFRFAKEVMVKVEKLDIFYNATVGASMIMRK
jgi:dihydroneopterin aldolase